MEAFFLSIHSSRCFGSFHKNGIRFLTQEILIRLTQREHSLISFPHSSPHKKVFYCGSEFSFSTYIHFLTDDTQSQNFSNFLFVIQIIKTTELHSFHFLSFFYILWMGRIHFLSFYHFTPELNSLSSALFFFFCVQTYQTLKLHPFWLMRKRKGEVFAQLVKTSIKLLQNSMSTKVIFSFDIYLPNLNLITVVSMYCLPA